MFTAGRHGGAVVSTVASEREGSGFWGISVWSLHAHASVGFLQLPPTLGVNVSVTDCWSLHVSPVIDRLATYQGCTLLLAQCQLGPSKEKAL